eukprot:2736387-Rhodomonas_salina.4
MPGGHSGFDARLERLDLGAGEGRLGQGEAIDRTGARGTAILGGKSGADGGECEADVETIATGVAASI